MAGKNEQKVIEAAKQVFVRYGYRRVTMADIAEAAHLSRPSLYLVFPSKEELLIAVTTQVFAALLNEIREGLDRFETPKEKLAFAFDIWTVRGFEIVQASPDAKDLLESSYEFAAEATNKAAADFVAIVVEILESLMRKQTKVDLSPLQVALILTNAMPGFKAAAKNTDQLRKLIAGLIGLVLASLNQQAIKSSKKLSKGR